jgi:hypothetical protein
MKTLFLKPSDQQKSKLGSLIDLHCNYDYTQWEKGFKHIDVDILNYEMSNEFSRFGSRKIYQDVKKLISEHGINLVIIPAMHFEISKYHINKWQQMGAKICFVFFDDSFRFENYNRYYLDKSNYILTQETRSAVINYEKAGYIASFFPCYPSKAWVDAISKKKTSKLIQSDEAVFVGAKIANRSECIQYLQKKSVNVSTYGRGWDSSWIESDSMYWLYADALAAISFTENISANHTKVLKARPFEIAISGGCLVAEDNAELKEYFRDGIDALYFKDPEECKDKIQLLINNPDLRQKLVGNSFEKSKAYFNFEAAWGKYLNVISGTENVPIKSSSRRALPKRAIKNAIYWKINVLLARKKIGTGVNVRNDTLDLLFEVFYLCNYYRSAHPLVLLLRTRASIFLKTNLKNFLKTWEPTKLIISKLRRIQFHIRRRRIYVSLIPVIYHLKIRRETVDIDTLDSEISRFLRERKIGETIIDGFGYSRDSKSPTLYSLAYAILTLSLLGELEDSISGNKLDLIAKLDSYQDESGIFAESITREANETDWWGARHLSLHVVSAYEALGATPRKSFEFLEVWEGAKGVDELLRDVDWNNPDILNGDFDNKIMNIAGLLQYKRDKMKSDSAAETLSILKKQLILGVNPETGLFGMFKSENSEMLSRMVQFTYHLYNPFWFDKEHIPFAENLVKNVLKTQNFLGGYGPKLNTSACEDIDSIDLLARLIYHVPSLKNEISSSLDKALNWVATNQVEDGGFVFRRFESYRYGHDALKSEVEAGSMFATWFRLLSIAVIAEAKGLKRYNFVDCPGYQFSIK